MKLRILLTSLSILIFQCSWSQDIHFTQYYTAPHTLNPSLAGDYKGDYRIANTFRSQWRKFDPGYLTNSLTYDQQIYLLNERFSGGINLVYDRSGINAFRIMKINLALAWHKVYRQNKFHVGFQAGYILKSFDVSKLTFPDQFDSNSGYFDPDLPSADDDLDDHIAYPDLNLGIGWDRKFGRHTPKFGFAVQHLNRPDESFWGNPNKVPLRYVFTAGDAWEYNELVTIAPQVLYMEQVKANDLMPGVVITRKAKDSETKISSVSYGAFWRNSVKSKTDAVALVLGFRYDLFDIGFSYDINVSEATTVTKYKGAFEISLIYTALNSRAVKVRIPCERY